MLLHLEYFYGGEADQFNFYRIPKLLFSDKRYKSVSIDAKVLYGLMLDRMSLSKKSGWLDDAQRVFIYYTLEDSLDMMGIGKDKAVKLFKELEEIGLIERKKQGQGRPARIYVKNFVLPVEPDGGDLRLPQTTAVSSFSETSEKPKSQLPGDPKTSEKPKLRLPNSRSTDFGKADRNYTEKNKTERTDTESSINPPTPQKKKRTNLTSVRQQMKMDRMELCREQIRENIDYEYLAQNHSLDLEIIDGYVEIMVEACCSDKDFVRICGEQMPTGFVKNRLLKLTHEHIVYVLDCMRNNTTLIGNVKAYTLAALYNAPVTIAQHYASLVSHDMAQGIDVS